MHLFYTPDIDGKNYTLSEEESKHCARVLRLKQGDHIQLIDGKGGLSTAVIQVAHDKHCQVEVVEQQQGYGQRNYELHLAIGPTKNIDRYEWFLEKCTEIGTDVFTPLLCDFSERKVVKHERQEKVITAAVKQSLTAYHPILHEMTEFIQLVAMPFEGLKLIAHCATSTSKTPLYQVVVPGRPVLILIGPEGDFSPKEIALALAHGFVEVSLGNSRLRTETAGVVACHTVCLVNSESYSLSKK